MNVKLKLMQLCIVPVMISPLTCSLKYGTESSRIRFNSLTERVCITADDHIPRI